MHAWLSFALLLIGVDAQFGPTPVPGQLQTQAQQLNATGWQFINCDPTTNVFNAEFFNALVSFTGGPTVFSFLAQCEEGGLIPNIQSIAVPPLATQEITFSGLDTTDPNSRFSIVGQLCSFILFAFIVDPLTNAVQFVQVSEETISCGNQQLTCGCGFWDIWCYLDGCQPQHSAFFWVLVDILSFIVLVGLVYIPILVSQMRHNNKVMSRWMANDSHVKQAAGLNQQNYVNEMVLKIREGRLDPKDLVQKWLRSDKVLKNEENTQVLARHQADLAARKRIREERARANPSRFGFLFKRAGGGYNEMDDLYEHAYDSAVDDGGYSRAVEMTAMDEHAPLPPFAGAAYDSGISHGAPVGPSATATAYRRSRRKPDRSDPLETQNLV